MTRTADPVSLAKALASPARLDILAALSERGTCVCGEVVEVVGLAQSTVSQHLKVLREAGLVAGEVEGTRTCYCVDHEGVAAARVALAGLLDGLSDRCCCAGTS